MKKLPCSDRSRPRTGRSTGARLYGLTEEEIGIEEAQDSTWLKIIPFEIFKVNS
jgi:hypothetical protein